MVSVPVGDGSGGQVLVLRALCSVTVQRRAQDGRALGSDRSVFLGVLMHKVDVLTSPVSIHQPFHRYSSRDGRGD